MNAPHDIPDSHTVVLQPQGARVMPMDDTTTPPTHTFEPPAQAGEHLRALAAACASVALVAGAAFMSWSAPAYDLVAAPIVAYDDVAPPTRPDPFESVMVQADAYVVYDVERDLVLAEYNADKVRPLASLTKVMTALVAYRSTDPDRRLAVTQYAIETEGDSGLLLNETWRLRDMLGFVLMTSSNDGADAVASAIGGLIATHPESTPEYVQVDTFVDEMNATASQLGLTNTRFRNAHGLDEPGGMYGGEGTALEMARLMAYTYDTAPTILEDTTTAERTYTSDDGFVHRSLNTNQYVERIPGIAGSKTGYTDDAGGNLAVVYNAGLGHPIVIVVLGSTVEGRFADVETLVDASYEYVRSGWYKHHVAGSTPFSS